MLRHALLVIRPINPVLQPQKMLNNATTFLTISQHAVLVAHNWHSAHVVRTRLLKHQVRRSKVRPVKPARDVTRSMLNPEKVHELLVIEPHVPVPHLERQHRILIRRRHSRQAEAIGVEGHHAPRRMHTNAQRPARSRQHRRVRCTVGQPGAMQAGLASGHLVTLPPHPRIRLVPIRRIETINL